jgi:hypothetical protein
MSTPQRIDFDAYASKWDAKIGNILHGLRELILEGLPGADEVIKWQVPVYQTARIICTLNAFKSKVNLQVWRGAELDDPASLLEGTGKAMRHISVVSLDNFPRQDVINIIKQAAALE